MKFKRFLICAAVFGMLAAGATIAGNSVTQAKAEETPTFTTNKVGDLNFTQMGRGATADPDNNCRLWLYTSGSDITTASYAGETWLSQVRSPDVKCLDYIEVIMADGSILTGSQLITDAGDGIYMNLFGESGTFALKMISDYDNYMEDVKVVTIKKGFELPAANTASATSGTIDVYVTPRDYRFTSRNNDTTPEGSQHMFFRSIGVDETKLNPMGMFNFNIIKAGVEGKGDQYIKFWYDDSSSGTSRIPANAPFGGFMVQPDTSAAYFFDRSGCWNYYEKVLLFNSTTNKWMPLGSVTGLDYWTEASGGYGSSSIGNLWGQNTEFAVALNASDGAVFTHAVILDGCTFPSGDFWHNFDSASLHGYRVSGDCYFFLNQSNLYYQDEINTFVNNWKGNVNFDKTKTDYSAFWDMANTWVGSTSILGSKGVEYLRTIDAKETGDDSEVAMYQYDWILENNTYYLNDFLGRRTDTPHTITFKSEGATYKTDWAWDGQKVKQPTNPTKEHYHLVEWRKEGETAAFDFNTGITADVTLNAVFEIDSFTVKFMNGETQIGEDQKVNYGSLATAPEDPTKTGYTFKAWAVDGEEVDVETYVIEEATTFDAVFTANAYKIKLEVDGTEISQISINYDSVPTKPEDPTKEGYTFSKWVIKGSETEFDWTTKYVTEGDTTLTAVFDINEYDVVFMHGSTVVDKQTVEHGDYATAPADPTEAGHTFKYWAVDGEEVDVEDYKIVEDVTFTAVFDVNTYTITIKVDDATETENVDYGSIPTKPENPTKEGYMFVGWFIEGTKTEFDWSVPYTTEGDTTVVAVFNINKYEVMFMNGSTVVDKQTVDHGDYATAPADPTEAGHTFQYWAVDGKEVDVEDYKIVEDTTFKAVFNANTYTITVKVDGEVSSTVSVDYDSVPTKPADPTKEGFTFVKWVIEGTDVEFNWAAPYTTAGDTTVDAVFSVNEYTVTFKDGDTVIGTEKVAYKGTVTKAPDAPAKEGYTFLGWFSGDLAFDLKTPITADMTITAKYKINEYTVTFKDGDTVIGTEKVNYGGTVTTMPDAPAKEGYEFKYWSLDGEKAFDATTAIKGDTTLKAVYEKKGGCGGSIVATSAIVSVLALAG